MTDTVRGRREYTFPTRDWIGGWQIDFSGTILDLLLIVWLFTIHWRSMGFRILTYKVKTKIFSVLKTMGRYTKILHNVIWYRNAGNIFNSNFSQSCTFSTKNYTHFKHFLIICNNKRVLYFSMHPWVNSLQWKINPYRRGRNCITHFLY